ncbi:MAG: GNAT family N-acetyltransferase [Solirubrobacterales bacterium]
MEVVPLPVDRSRDAACLLADAFRDYPAWRSIGPRRAHPRRRMVERFYRGALARAGELGEVLSASEDGRLRGIAITYPPERWPPSLASFYHEAWGVALCGPGAIVRGLRATAAVDAAHPREPHVFLHTLGVDPAAQRRGAGAALLEHMIAEAEERAVPIHLTTSTPDNLPYYRRFGFELDGEDRLPRDVPLWSMLRPVVARG